MSNQGKEYELLVKDVYECLNKAEGLSNIEIQHNVLLSGVSGVEHQIDLYWRFKKATVEYRVIIECKDYKRRVGKDKIMAFKELLTDIGNVHGIFVSRMGFQSGAREYAAKYGIQLMEIRKPTEKDWEGRMRNIHFEYHIRTIQNVRPQIIASKSTSDELKRELECAGGFSGQTDQIFVDYGKVICDDKVLMEDGRCTMLELINLLPNDKIQNDCRCMYIVEGGIVHGYDLSFPIDRVEIVYDMCESVVHSEIRGDDVIKAIVKDITEGSEIHVDSFGEVRNRS